MRYENLSLEQILRFTQAELKAALATELESRGYAPIAENGYLYAPGTLPVLLVAHLDTVHHEPVRDICRSGDGTILMSPQGIGGDDRAGVYMALRILEQARCHVLFCEDEETGGQGARKFTASDLAPDVNYIVEMDRRGHDDAVFYRCDNREFVDFVTEFGFQEAYGSFSDISVIAPYLGVAAVNISAGYYNEHRPHEHINLTHVEHNIARILEMVMTPSGQFEYIERETYGFGAFDSQIQLWDHFPSAEQRQGSGKLLMPVPETAYVEVNGRQVENGLAHFMDKQGIVYDCLEELDVAVRANYTKAYEEDGRPLKFSKSAATRIKVVSLEEAMARLV